MVMTTEQRLIPWLLLASCTTTHPAPRPLDLKAPVLPVIQITEMISPQNVDCGMCDSTATVTWPSGFQIKLEAKSRDAVGVHLSCSDGACEDIFQHEITHCDATQTRAELLNGPYFVIGFSCILFGGDNNYTAQDVAIFKFENTTETSQHIALVWRGPGSGSSVGYYENLVTVTSFEVRGETIVATTTSTQGPSEANVENGDTFEPIVNVRETVVWPNGPVFPHE